MFTVLHGLHLLSIAAALGGTIVLRFVVCPMILGTEEGQETRRAILARWRPIVWILIAVILVTGLANSHQAYMRVGPDFVYWSVFMVKFFSALALFSIVLMLTLPMEAFDKFRQERDKWMHFIVAIGTLILFLSAFLRMNFPKLPQ